MLKRMLSILSLLVFVATFSSLSYANNSSVIDTPNVEMLDCGSFDAGLRFSSKGDLISKIEFGVLRFLNLGFSWEWNNFIADKRIDVAFPALQAKFRIYEGDMVLPGLLVGYDGQGYFFESKKGKYSQKGRGVYFVAGREIFTEGFMLNIGVNVKVFSSSKIYGFVNAIAPLHKDNIFFMMEYDNVHNFSDARLNLGLKFILKKFLSIDCVLRDCFGNRNDGNKEKRYSGERILRIGYSARL